MKINRVLLVMPPAFSSNRFRETNPLPPIGLGYLASTLENMDIEVRILDCLIRGWEQEEVVNKDMVRIGLSDSQIRGYITDFNPDMVGINCQFSRQFRMYHHIFSLIKNCNPQIITVAGGAHATVCTEEVLLDDNCDYVIKGEGEITLKRLIERLPDGGDLDAVDGLCRKVNGALKINEKTTWIENLDEIPFPAYHLMDLERYDKLKDAHGERHRDRFSPIVTTRGCPAKCTFCTAKMVWGDRFRARSVENVIQEMRLLKNKYSIEEIMFEDDNLTANPTRSKELFSRMIEEGFDFIWDTPNGVGVWSIDEEIIDKMKQSGCVRLCFPVESGSQRVLNEIIRKPLNLDKVKHLIEYCRKIDLDFSVFLVIGMPGEKIEEMWESFRFVAGCGCYAPHISVATPYPGSQLYEDCKNKGYLAKDYSLDDLYIRSFMIKTDDWDGEILKNILLKAHIYFKLRMLRDDPARFFIWLYKSMKRLPQLTGYLINTFGKH